MKWTKKGLIYTPEKKKWWSQHYAMVPTPEYIQEENVIRIYFGTTDNDIYGRTTYLDVNADNPSEVLYLHDDYILDIGQAGMFDDSGAIPCSVININGNKYLHYIGFQRCAKVPYMLFSGIAVQKSDKWEKISKAPIIDRNNTAFISNSSPFVLQDDGIYKMWFWVGKAWVEINKKLYIRAEISYAESADGVHWGNYHHNCITLNGDNEFSLGRPYIVKDGAMYKMWYSLRHVDKLYRIGYAESADGITWQRKDDEAGIDVSEKGWDSEMVCYPAVITVKNKTYMFYNGNNNGETGFGYAELN